MDNLQQQMASALEMVFPNEKKFMAGKYIEIESKDFTLTVTETAGEVFLFFDRYLKNNNELSRESVEISKQLLKNGIQTNVTVFDNRKKEGTVPKEVFKTVLNKKELFKTSTREWIKRCWNGFFH